MDYMTNEAVEQYLLGKLSPADQEGFEKAMKDSTILQKEVAIQKELLGTLQDMGDLLLLRRIQELSKERKQQKLATKTIKSLNRRRFMYILSAAASILLLVVGYFSFFQVPLNQRLFDAHFTPYELESLRSNPDLEKGKQLYAAQNYTAALVYFEKIQTLNNESKMAVGICYLQTGAYPNAIAHFEDLAQIPSYKTVALWYQALSYLKSNDLEKTKTVLTQVIPLDSPYAQKAQKILEALEK